MTTEPTMNAALVPAFGDPSVITYTRVPRPVPGPGRVLVRVAATSYNPSDVGLRSGALRGILPVEPPFVLGTDVSGTVAATGPGVTAFAPGDRVVGRLDGGGAAAEYAVAAETELTAAPAAVPLAVAAALPVAGHTAWQALFEHAAVGPGDRVLVGGAGGGVGRFAVQLARHAGAHVIATASGRSAAAVRRLGAHEIVDYTRTPLAEAVGEPVDLALHLVPSTEAGTALAALVRPGGSLVSATGPVPVADPSVRAVHFVARNDTAQLAALVGLVDAGAVRVEAAARPLRELADVHRAGEAGEIAGKVVLTPVG
ncbi:NADP-dependent oxidoreductase [Actinomadura kijaniata]|uniref:NADP-dependent oxidoreductase n=1 Tax=Actinomadura kijaniata TaxID=46161 RepID=UPI000B106059|nr:NADP-dependent oxidoreductase [Actinomadura kijaniata]